MMCFLVVKTTNIKNKQQNKIGYARYVRIYKVQ